METGFKVGWRRKAAQQLSHQRHFLSKWRAASSKQDPLNTVKIVDRFVIRRTENSNIEASNGSGIH